MKLTRRMFLETGIFGELSNDDDSWGVYTLEHSYPLAFMNESGVSYSPRLPNGQYTCVRGLHRLHNSIDFFETFEVTNVPLHTGILFHAGNFNRDSEGCILIGLNKNELGLEHSRSAFVSFMELMSGIDQFTLTVE